MPRPEYPGRTKQYNYCLWWYQVISSRDINTLRPRQNGHHFADDTFKRIFLNENVRISIEISLKFVPMGPINNIPALVQIMAWRRSGDKPLSGPMMDSLLTHICVTRPQWVNCKMMIVVFLEERCQLFATFRCWKIIWNANIVVYLLRTNPPTRS